MIPLLKPLRFQSDSSIMKSSPSELNTLVRWSVSETELNATTRTSLLLSMTLVALLVSSFVTITEGFLRTRPGQMCCSRWSSLKPYPINMSLVELAKALFPAFLWSSKAQRKLARYLLAPGVIITGVLSIGTRHLTTRPLSSYQSRLPCGLWTQKCGMSLKDALRPDRYASRCASAARRESAVPNIDPQNLVLTPMPEDSMASSISLS